MQNSDGGISDFWISLIKENCHSSRPKDDIDIKLRPVTKLDKKNKTKSKEIDNDVILVDCDDIIIFSVYGQFEAIQKPVSRRIVRKTYSFINSNLLFYNLLQISYTALTLLLWVKVPFLPKNGDFWLKITDINKIKRA